jgi:hypothetical protein
MIDGAWREPLLGAKMCEFALRGRGSSSHYMPAGH